MSASSVSGLDLLKILSYELLLQLGISILYFATWLLGAEGVREERTTTFGVHIRVDLHRRAVRGVQGLLRDGPPNHLRPTILREEPLAFQGLLVRRPSHELVLLGLEPRYEVLVGVALGRHRLHLLLI